MNRKIPDLQEQIFNQEESLNERIKEIEGEWAANRPKEASTRPEVASTSIKNATNWLSVLGTKIKNTKTELARVCKAKELLDMELGDPTQLDNLEED